MAVYARAWELAFVPIDDGLYVTSNPWVLRGLSWSGLRWSLTATEIANYWHPLTWWSHMLDVEIYGLRAGGHHGTSVILHALSTGILFVVLRGMTGAVGRSAFVAALFGLHPMHVESVAWVAERKDVLAGLFWFLALGAYGRFARGGTVVGCRLSVVAEQGGERNGGTDREFQMADQRRPSPDNRQPTTDNPFLWYGLTLLFFACGLMSKPMVVTLPLVLLLVDWWPLRRAGAWAPSTPFDAAPVHGPWGGVRPLLCRWRELMIEKAPFLILSAAISVWVLYSQTQAGAVSGSDGLALRYRVATALIAGVTYLGKTFWPVGLTFFYPHPAAGVNLALAGMSGIVLGLTTVGVLRLRRRCPYLLWGWLWYVVTLLPVSGIVQVGRTAMADRYSYIPLVGIFVALAWGAVDIARVIDPGMRRAPRWLVTAAAVVILLCIPPTWRQIATWENGTTLANHALRVVGDNAAAYACLGEEALKTGQFEHAETQLREALRVDPHYAEARVNLAVALLRQGRAAEALAELQRAVRDDPANPTGRTNLGALLCAAGRVGEGLPHLRAAVRLRPSDADARNNLGRALLLSGHAHAAVEAFEAALRLRPDLATASQNLAQARAAAKGPFAP